MKIAFTLNNQPVEIETTAEARLIDVLRNEIKFTGTKESCGEGQCGACSVLINNKLVLACLTPMIKVDGADVKTIEFLSRDGKLDYVQQAFIDVDAAQCGFCTSGFVMTIKDYIDNGGENNEEAIKKAISGNICRCTGYTSIINAVKLAFEYKAKLSK